MAAVVGVHGMAWGSGMHPSPSTGPEKREGDGKSPAGIFSICPAYGYDSAPPSKTLWPYRQSTSDLCCVDDSKSRHYNRIVSKSKSKDWTSAEEMVRPDGLYRRVIGVGHNLPAAPSKGSCIFLHVWKNGHTGTSGCTAISLKNIEFILAWLDPAARPVLVQLPKSVHRDVEAAWGLPAIR